MPKLTVIIPTYKRDKLFEDCLASALSIFDDGAQYIVGNSNQDDTTIRLVRSKFNSYRISCLDLAEHECDMY